MAVGDREAEVHEAGAPTAPTSMNEREALTPSGDVKVAADRTSQALLAAILREIRKTNLILMEAYKTEVGRLEVKDEDVEV